MTARRHPDLAVVGATGAVGRTMLTVLAERGVDPVRIRALASDRSAGQRLDVGGAGVEVEALEEADLDGLRLALFALDDPLARVWVPRFRERGVLVVDNSATYRLDPEVPLVIPEVNGALLESHPSLVANPNCSTIVLVMAITPLVRAVGVRRVVAVTFQSASGAGAPAIDELLAGTRALLDGHEPPASKVFPRPLALDVIPHVGGARDDGRTREEWKIEVETRRILDLPDLPVSTSCVRVPVLVSHGVAIHLELARSLETSEAHAILAGMPGVVVGDGADALGFATPRTAAGRDEIFVGRIRQDPGLPHGLAMWAVGDNLRKGAASNAVDIAGRLLGGWT
jgi:aspartate-semialdehyde dehydrogenase